MTSIDFRKFFPETSPRRAAESRCFVIGEVAQSHDGSLGMAHAFVDAIADAGADAIKFQTHIAAEESTPGEPWRIKFSRQDETRFDYWRRMEFTKEQWRGLKEHCDERGILFMSTPFSHLAVDWLREIGMKVWKIASGEIGNLPLLRRIAQNGDPVILSSGISPLAELDAAVELIRGQQSPVAVLQCTTAYPCPPERVGLNVMTELRGRYGIPVGLSDHSGKIYAGLAAAALGAEIVEVHVALSREMFGPDVIASVTTAELRQLTEGIAEINRMLASPVDKEAEAAQASVLRATFTKSIVAARELAAGTVLTEADLSFKKPGTGIPPAKLPEVVGKTLTIPIPADGQILPHQLV